MKRRRSYAFSCEKVKSALKANQPSTCLNLSRPRWRVPEFRIASVVFAGVRTACVGDK